MFGNRIYWHRQTIGNSNICACIVWFTLCERSLCFIRLFGIQTDRLAIFEFRFLPSFLFVCFHLIQLIFIYVEQCKIKANKIDFQSNKNKAKQTKELKEGRDFAHAQIEMTSNWPTGFFYVTFLLNLLVADVTQLSICVLTSSVFSASLVYL